MVYASIIPGGPIAGYQPNSDVKQHLRLDLDQRDFEYFLKNENFSSAADIYINGGNSLKTSKIRIDQPLETEISKGATVEQGSATGKTVTKAREGGDTLKLGITSKCIGQFAKEADTAGCFKEFGDQIKIDGVEVGYPTDVNLRFRNLAGFSVEAESKMKGQEMFEIYKDFYGAPDYADKFIKAALKGQDETKRVKVPMTFLGREEIFRNECAKKGSAYWSVWMYVIREMEDAVSDCQINCQTCNDAHVHAWDEAWAFYSGSLEGQDGHEGGRFLYRLAQKRCKNYQTCDAEGVADVNKKLVNKFSEGKELLDQGKCEDVQPIKKEIINLMSVPLIQGTLRYAYKTTRGDNTPKERAEGIAFLGSIVPRLYACSHEDAEIVMNHMWFDGDMETSDDGFKTVKEAFERNYACMGVTCADVGGHIDDLTDDYYKDFEPCNA